MPRKARIDTPGALHHIIVRGIERRSIFYDDLDRENFIEEKWGQANNVRQFNIHVMAMSVWLF